jgi:signal transduction histidine kinase
MLILVVAMALLGKLVTERMSASITAGVANTAAASMDVMLADELAEIGPERPLTPEAIAGLDSLSSAASNARANKLIQLRLRNPDGSVLYQSLGGLEGDAPSAETLAAARSGHTSSRLLNLPLLPIGPFPQAVLAVLKIVTPIHDRASGAVIATAELYFAGQGTLALEDQAQQQVWLAVAGIGLVAIAALFLLVDRTGRTITRQRQHLAQSLAASRRLASENGWLRQQANVANEQLLAQVGSDLHDSPLQMLALLILRLSRHGESTAAETALAQQTMEELRGISAGLVLPELSRLDLRQTIELAIARHEEVTGTRIAAELCELPDDASPDLKACLYRIVQEGLGNARRHGAGGPVRLDLGHEHGRLTLEITNPVHPAEAAPEPSADRPRLGMDGMRSRLDTIGGRMHFEKDSARARLSVEAPL